MSIPTKNAKSKLDEQLINVYTRNGNSVTTVTSCVDYSGKIPVQKYSFSKTAELSVPNT